MTKALSYGGELTAEASLTGIAAQGADDFYGMRSSIPLEVTLDKEGLADSSVSVTLENTAGMMQRLPSPRHKQQMC